MGDFDEAKVEHCSASVDVVEDGADLCAFFRRSRNAGRYEVIQARGKAGWGIAWTFAARDVHAAERAGWMMRRFLNSVAVPVRHACLVRLRTTQASREIAEAVDVVVVTILPARSQVVLKVETGARVIGLPLLRCGGREDVSASMGLAASRGR